MNKEFYEDARKVAESCSKERLMELYLAEVQTCCELEEHKEIADNTIEMYVEKSKVLEKALELACLVISKAMCPNGDWETLKRDFANAYKEQAQKEIQDE